ncbi:hypothetical protein BT63DRAFT_419211 [Microthyrium microscopicum]|uniref:Ribosomal protein L9 domain-containing protein n=1 Tax=Microthyrium microscopicum TaxID=703497 RepID=A0A6A6TTI9_9PEZI|nr:hypothetical protein BT63DRAFT_419211 [Microthyrium microscopicum]
MATRMPRSSLSPCVFCQFSLQARQLSPRTPVAFASTQTQQVTVELLQPVPQWGPPGTILRVAPGFMRNNLHPKKQARYIVGDELKQILQSNIKFERQRSFLLDEVLEQRRIKGENKALRIARSQDSYLEFIQDEKLRKSMDDEIVKAANKARQSAEKTPGVDTASADRAQVAKAWSAILEDAAQKPTRAEQEDFLRQALGGQKEASAKSEGKNAAVNESEDQRLETDSVLPPERRFDYYMKQAREALEEEMGIKRTAQALEDMIQHEEKQGHKASIQKPITGEALGRLPELLGPTYTFERKPIPSKSDQALSQPNTPETAIFGSVNKSEIVQAVRARLASDAALSRINIKEEHITITSNSEDGARLKQLGVAEVEINILPGVSVSTIVEVKSDSTAEDEDKAVENSDLVRPLDASRKPVPWKLRISKHTFNPALPVTKALNLDLSDSTTNKRVGKKRDKQNVVRRVQDETEMVERGGKVDKPFVINYTDGGSWDTNYEMQQRRAESRGVGNDEADDGNESK